MKKLLVFGVIVLFLGLAIAPSTGTIKEKISSIQTNLDRDTPSENSIICGFIIDFETNDSIAEAFIYFTIEVYQGNYYSYDTFTNETGFYYIENIVTGLVAEYGAYANGYHEYWGQDDIEIGENETVWVNMTMYPFQPETSLLCGYVKDATFGKPIYNASVYLHWSDINNQLTYNGSITDETGFYSIHLGAGSFQAYAVKFGYIDDWSYNNNIGDYETIWINFSMTLELEIDILKPKHGIYINNKMITAFFVPVIIGTVDVEVNVTLNGGNPIDHVEIIIDGVSENNLTSEPYTYQWNEKTPFRFRHLIEVIAHRNWASNSSKKLIVWKLF